MNTYHKINAVFKRDSRGNFTNEFAEPCFEYLQNNIWVGTEKVNGTNVRICWDGENISIKGKEDKTEIPPFLYEKLNEIFQDIDLGSVFGNDRNVILFGEGYGNKIQDVGSKYISEGVDFILFDVMYGDDLLSRKDVDEVASILKIKSVPVVFEGTLWEGINFVKNGFKSHIGNLNAEGIVMVPKVNLLDKRNRRIITKLKTVDFN